MSPFEEASRAWRVACPGLVRMKEVRRWARVRLEIVCRSESINDRTRNRDDEATHRQRLKTRPDSLLKLLEHNQLLA